MLKYVDVMVVFAELPDEITLAINLSGCPCACQGCHSSYLANDIGTELSSQEIDNLITKHQGISAICFMGGDGSPLDVENLARYISSVYPNLNIGWYSGRDKKYSNIDYSCFDYVKIGPYIAKHGPLDSPTTNQRLYKVIKKNDVISFVDVTKMLQK